MIDKKYRNNFPLLAKENPPIYFDNACMTLKPNVVIDAISEYYREYPVCEGRSGHKLAYRMNTAMLDSRKAMQRFIGASSNSEIVFTKNTTEALNIVALGIDWKSGDSMLVSDKEHNSNFLAWQHLRGIGVKVVVVEPDENNLFSLENWETAIKKHKPRFLTCYMTSNLDGETAPIKELCSIAKKHDVMTCVDGAQGAAHQKIDVSDIDCDFLALSVHKMCGPTGVGILYGKKERLEELSPFIRGGGTVIDVSYENATLLEPPRIFEAGLQNYAGIIAVKHAVEYLEEIGLKNVHDHEIELSKHLQKTLVTLPDVTIIGPQKPEDRGGITSISVKDFNVHDLAMALDDMVDIMIRAGRHCVHGWFNKTRIDGTLRVSTYLYNTIDEIDTFTNALTEILAEE
ncbi:MAG: cysteine desulfurase [Caldisericia bacterium]|nr:cysteine desulfurase [Caldisericia bacterium]